MSSFTLNREIDAVDATRDSLGYRGERIPADWKRITLSLGCGERVIVWHKDDHVLMVRGAKLYGVETFLERGQYTRIHRGSEKTANAVRMLCESALAVGFREAIRQYSAATVRCCCCGCELTNPESKSRAIGPKCIRTIHGAALARIFGLLV